MVIGVAAMGLLASVWVPKGNYSPISPTERGTLAQGVKAVNPANLAHLRGVPPSRAPDTTVPANAGSRPTTGPGNPTAPTTTVATSVSPTTIAPQPRATVAPRVPIPTTRAALLPSTTMAGATPTTTQ